MLPLFKISLLTRNNPTPLYTVTTVFILLLLATVHVNAPIKITGRRNAPQDLIAAPIGNNKTLSVYNNITGTIIVLYIIQCIIHNILYLYVDKV